MQIPFSSRGGPVRIFAPEKSDKLADRPVCGCTLQSSTPRILIVSGTLDGGGAERFASTLMQHINITFDVSLCLFRDEIAYPVPGNVDVSVLGHRGPWTSRRTVHRLRDLIDREDPDIVLSTMDYLGMFTGEALRITRTKPFWIARTSNSPEFQFRSLRGRLRKQWLKHVYPRADLFVANSEGVAESFQRTFACARDKTRVVLNPVDIARLERLADDDWPEPINPDIANICYSARLQRHKRPDVMIRAFRQILDRKPAKLWICGDGPMRRRIENMIEKHKLRDHVRMVGFRSNIFPILKSSLVAVATSDYEGMPNNLLEAQALGIPVVSTRSSFGPEEIIDHEQTGLLTDRGDAEMIADAVLRLANDERLRSDIATEGKRAVMERFSLNATVPAWETLLAESAGCEALHTDVKTVHPLSQEAAA